jgi:hypothetical protein
VQGGRQRSCFMQGTQQHVSGSGNFRSSPGDACVTPHPSATVSFALSLVLSRESHPFMNLHTSTCSIAWMTR